MSWLGLGDFVLDGDSFSAEALSKMIRSLEKEEDSITNVLREQLPDFRAAVQAQYDQVFRLVDPVGESQ